MQVVHGRCAGLDVHKETVSACVSVCQRRWLEGAAGASVWGLHPRSAGAGRLAEAAGSDARGDGSDGRLLAAGVGGAGGAVRADAGESATHQGGTGA
ncbi:MAG: hypothetical protein MZV70_02085 [Desulfobacterales bacterium]|nr:hypothetical protein [Desulfobacterales bacterium]